MNQTETAIAVSNALSTRKMRENYFGEFIGGQIEVGRNLICQYKYPENPQFFDFNTVYKRIGPARAIIDKKTEATWAAWPTVRDVVNFNDDGEADYQEDGVKSKFEAAWFALLKNRKLKLKTRLQALDRKQLIGRFGGLMIVAKGVNNLSASDPMPPLSPGAIISIKAYSEGQLEINQWHEDPATAECGQPKMYMVKDFGADGRLLTFECHPSRIIAYSSSADDGAFYGDPELQACFYALLDWEKIRMSSAEGMKKNADQRSVITLDDGTSAPSAPALKQIGEDVNAFNNGEKNTIMMTKADLKSLSSTMGDPTQAAELCEKEIAARSGMPTTEIFGYQTGRLASEKDNDKWNGRVAERRDGPGTDVIMLFIDWCIEYGVLPEPEGDIVIDWPDAREPSKSDKLAMAEQASNIRDKIVKAGGIGSNVITDQYIADLLGVKVEDVETDIDESLDD
jgi:hypothetical protein